MGAFENMARAYRMEVPENAEQIISGWRKANSKIVAFWYDVEKAFRLLLSDDYDGATYRVGKLKMARRGSTVRVTLPNSYNIRYHGARISENDEIVYLGMNPKTFNWSVLYTHGARVVQNITEAVGRCLLGEALVDAETADLAPVLHCHDEMVCDSTPGRLDEFKACMERPRAWAAGLPVAADCHAMLRYRKM